MCELYFLRAITSLQNRLFINQVVKFSRHNSESLPCVFAGKNKIKLNLIIKAASCTSNLLTL